MYKGVQTWVTILTECSSGISPAISQALNSRSDLHASYVHRQKTKQVKQLDSLNTSWKQRHVTIENLRLVHLVAAQTRLMKSFLSVMLLDLPQRFSSAAASFQCRYHETSWVAPSEHTGPERKHNRTRPESLHSSLCLSPPPFPSTYLLPSLSHSFPPSSPPPFLLLSLSPLPSTHLNLSLLSVQFTQR